ncbi:hypothetical protein RB195_010190 [Necator americanus]|uniref:BPTI/Kunitz inhibitor domain-containing protein n=1 Tax=Necator americanus TaxID=51031 RepID=A0ABR1CWV0_NECAM
MIFAVHLLLIHVAYGSDLGGVLCRLPKDEGYQCGTVGAAHSAFYFDSDFALCGKSLPLMDFAGNIKRCEPKLVPCPLSHECVGHGMESVCCLKADQICQASLNAGSSCGIPPQTRYYYDAPSRLCRSFTFTGCGGNENNFKTKGECTQFCNAEIVCLRGDPHPDRYSINKVATCHEDKHCPRNYTCTAAYGRKGACCPSRDFVCGTPLNERSTRRSVLKEKTWSFNYRKGECEMNEHTVGDEQWNKFASQEQCVDFCIGKCPNHLDVHYNPLTGQPQLCDARSNSGCPLGFECVRTSSFAAVCCRTNPLCPSSESLLLLQNGAGKRCDPDTSDSCPEHYSCQQAKNLEHICCTRPLMCPEGMDALREDGDRLRICTPGVEGNCPTDHVCADVSGHSGTRHLCCRPEKKCIVPYVDFVKKRPKRCFPGDSSCPSSTSCLPVREENENATNTVDLLFFCCHSVDVFTCPDSQMPVMDKATNRPMRLNNIDEEYDRLVEYLHDCTKKAESFKTTKRRLSLETLELVRQRGTAPAAENQKLTSELAMLCREAIKEDLKERKAKRWLKLQRREKCPSRLRQSQDEDDCSPKLEGNNHCIKKGKGENLLRLLL